MECQLCGGVQCLRVLGHLGNRVLLRCRDCGQDTTIAAETITPLTDEDY